MSVTARFYVRQITRHAGFAGNQQPGYAAPAPQVEVTLNPVSDAKGEQNKSWASATPSGEIKMTIGNPEAAAWFDSMLGKDVAITFEERDDSE